jgi:propanol-preferring alcohol dehydrogenase
LDAELDEPKLPLVMGHQIVGTVEEVGNEVDSLQVGDRVGVPWLGGTDSTCKYCQMGRENLCDNARFTGYNIDGGFAEYAVADAQFSFPIPDDFPDLQAAPLLCAGLIGYRAWRLMHNERVSDEEPIDKVGFYGFGSAAHILTQVALYEGKEVYAFTRPGDEEGQAFARRLGAVWAGGSDETPPEELDAAILFAPVGELVPASLRAVRKGGIVVGAGIHMSEIPAFPYDILWGERVVRSVANLERKDGVEFLELAPKVPIRTEVTTFDLSEANEALEALRKGEFQGSAVLTIS